MRRKATKSYLFRLVWAALTCLSLTGCATTHFGGRLVTVTLRSPVSGVAYLVPEHHLDEDPSLVADRNRLDDIGHDYRKGQIGPNGDVTLRLMGEMWAFVVFPAGGGAPSRPVMFNPEQLSDATVTADFAK